MILEKIFNLACTMEVITTERGAKKLCVDGYIYTKNKQYQDRITWRCVLRGQPTKCTGSLHTPLSMATSVEMNPHNHPADSAKVEVAKFRCSTKRRAAETLERPNQILTLALPSLSDDAKATLPDSETIKRTLRRQRAKHMPPDPKQLQNLIVSGDWALTADPVPTQFLLHDSGTDSDRRIMVFSTAEHLRVLAASVTWAMDGTFSVAPLLFGQLFIIHGQVDNTFVPLVYALLQHKDQVTYEELFQVLLNHGAEPNTVIIDFERASRQAITSVFGPEVVIRCCFYHLTQSTWRKIQGLGLSTLYKENEEFRHFCAQLDGLAFLPLEEVKEGMDHLQDIASEDAAPLVDYFNQTYVSGVYRIRNNTNSDTIKMRHVPPAFPPATWNMHEATLEGDPRTNNISEGFNNKLAHLVGTQHPSVWRLIECLRSEKSRVDTVLLQDARGHKPYKRRRLHFQKLQERLMNLCHDRIQGKKSIPEFLRGIGFNLRTAPKATTL